MAISITWRGRSLATCLPNCKIIGVPTVTLPSKAYTDIEKANGTHIIKERGYATIELSFTLMLDRSNAWTGSSTASYQQTAAESLAAFFYGEPANEWERNLLIVTMDNKTYRYTKAFLLDGIDVAALWKHRQATVTFHCEATKELEDSDRVKSGVFAFSGAADELASLFTPSYTEPISLRMKPNRRPTLYLRFVLNDSATYKKVTIQFGNTDVNVVKYGNLIYRNWELPANYLANLTSTTRLVYVFDYKTNKFYACEDNNSALGTGSGFNQPKWYTPDKAILWLTDLDKMQGYAVTPKITDFICIDHGLPSQSSSLVDHFTGWTTANFPLSTTGIFGTDYLAVRQSTADGTTGKAVNVQYYYETGGEFI